MFQLIGMQEKKSSPLKQDNQISLKNGLIKTDASNLEAFFNSPAFDKFYTAGFITLEKKAEDTKEESPEAKEDPNDWRKVPPRKTPFLSEEDERRIREGFTAFCITSVQIKDGDGFIEFEANEFPLHSLKELAPTCKGGFEVVWLDPERTKFTHTVFSEDGKSKYNEHGFDKLESLFAEKGSSKKTPKKSKKFDDLDIN